MTILATGALVAACAPTPRLEIAAPVLSQSWAVTSPADDAWGNPSDAPSLTALLERALQWSPELMAAGARVDQARALARAARAAGMPVISASAITRSRGEVFDFGGSLVSVDGSFTPDLAGERGAERRAAAARSEAAAAELEALKVRIAADIAAAVVQRAALARRLELLDESIAYTGEVERVVSVRVREGEASRVELGLQALRSRRLAAERRRLVGALDPTRAARALLLGSEAPGFDAAPHKLDELDFPEPRVPTPVQLATGRADLRAAEAQLRAAGGDVAIARAAFFPQISLSASSAAAATLSSGLTLGAGLLAPIFNRAELTGRLDAVAARQRETAFMYRQAVLAALAEVQSALAAVATAKARATVLDELLDQASATERLARQRYIEGEAGLQELLDAQDLLVAAKDAKALARQEQLEAVISLWRASGLQLG